MKTTTITCDTCAKEVGERWIEFRYQGHWDSTDRVPNHFCDLPCLARYWFNTVQDHKTQEITFKL